MQEKIHNPKTESIIYKLVRDKDLSDEERELIDKIIEDKDYNE
jgi:hypothetical protein